MALRRKIPVFLDGPWMKTVFSSLWSVWRSFLAKLGWKSIEVWAVLENSCVFVKLTSPRGPTWVCYCVIQLLTVVIWTSGAGRLWSTLFTKHRYNFWFLLFRSLWFSWKPTFYYFYFLPFKVASLAKSYNDSFSWPERHYFQASISFGGRGKKGLCYCVATLCFRLCLGHILYRILWSMTVVSIIG